MRTSTGGKARLAAVVAAVALFAAACAANSSGGGSSSSSSSGSKKIALLLPETKTTRYEAQDRPLFEAKVRQLCPDCQILYSNADQKADLQQNQVDAALTNGAKVLVLDPVDSASAASIVAKAKAQNVPVISYDRLITNADIDYCISFNNVAVGKLQARSLVGKLKADGHGSGTIVMINGAPTDNNAKLFKQGALSVLDSGGLKIGKQYDTPDWSP
ncbi:MAG TPA: substrate-binding domain-containing protein, partial [Actinomycetota bacterium]|nr:substrate-binding domain-containing protein [Actinomycetota bacterium]